MPAQVFAGVLALVPSACSIVPDSVLPAHRDHNFHASYLIGSDGRLTFPSTTRDLVIRSLLLAPKPLSEQFESDRRWFVYPAGTTVHARGELRAYADASGEIPELSELLPDAKLHQTNNAQ